MTDYEDYENNLAFPPTTDRTYKNKGVKRMKKFIRYLAIALPIWTIAGIWSYSKCVEVRANNKAIEYYTIQSHLACHQLENAGCEYSRGCK